MFQVSLYLIILFFSVFIGFFSLQKNDPKYLKHFPIFLLTILIIEFIEQLQQSTGKNNVFLYNIVSIYEFAFYAYFFSQEIPAKKIKKVIIIVSYSLFSICLLNIFFIQGMNNFHTFSYIFGCICMIAMSILYFFQLFKRSDNIDLLRTPSFWFTTGIIFFYFCSLSVFGALNYIAILPKIIRNSLHQIVLLTNAFFYFIFIIAFLCKHNILKYLSK